MATKYHNRKTEFQGIVFDSQKEAHRYQELLWMRQAGKIHCIEVQPRYDLIVNGVKIGFYKADFRYFDKQTGIAVVEDVKGVRTPIYNLKKKLMAALYGIEIVEV
jgi:hypothetical protein